jgi:hypothetical protein
MPKSSSYLPGFFQDFHASPLSYRVIFFSLFSHGFEGEKNFEALLLVASHCFVVVKFEA